MSEDGMTLLPGWALETIGDITNRTGQRVPSEDFIYVDIGSVDGERGVIQTPKKLATDEAPSRARKEIRASDTIFATTRPYLKNIAFVPPWLDDQIYSTGFCVLRPLEFCVDPKFLFHLLRTDLVLLQVNKFMRGVSYPAVSDKDILSAEISLPPLNEQKRIVEKLEQLLSELDKAVDALKSAQQKLKTYRRAVLKAAVEGELSRAWREENKERLEPAEKLLERILAERRKKWEEAELEKLRAKGKEPKDDKWKEKYKEPEAPDLGSLLDLPNGWTWVNLGRLSDVTGGLTKNPKRAEFPKKLPYLRVANVYADKLRLEDVEEIGVAEAELNRVLLEDNDLLVVEGNGSPDQIGRMALWKSQVESCVHQNHLIKARFYMMGFERFSMSWFLSLGGREVIRKVASSTSGLYTLSIAKVSALPLPLAPLEETDYMLEKLDEELSVIDKLDDTLKAKLIKGSALRQFILQKAFSGQLVPQDPNDESASVLLERIRAEREAAGAKGKRGKKKTADNAQPRLLEVDA